MVVGHYQPLADDGLLHRPTKPVFCSRFRRRRQASLCAATSRAFKRRRWLACLRHLEALARSPKRRRWVRCFGGPTAPACSMFQCIPSSATLPATMMVRSFAVASPL